MTTTSLVVPDKIPATRAERRFYTSMANKIVTRDIVLGAMDLVKGNAAIGLVAGFVAAEGFERLGILRPVSATTLEATMVTMAAVSPIAQAATSIIGAVK